MTVRPTNARPDDKRPDLPVDFGLVAGDYGQWRQGFPPAFFARLEPLGVGRPGQRVLDLGTGTGLLARGFARRGCAVTGLDPSPAMLEEARRADAAAGTAVEYRSGKAEVTGLPDASFDVVSAATCWHWFDRAKAAAEARRVLRPDGRLLIATLDWHFARGNVCHATWKLIERFNPAKEGTNWLTFEYPKWTLDLTVAGFDAWEVFAFTTVLEYSHEAWRGRVRASARVGPQMDPATLERFDAALAKELRERFGPAPLAVDHRVFALVTWSRDGVR